jgi:hypothetical protein
MTTLAAWLLGFLMTATVTPASAGPNYLVWSIAHDRMVAGWRCAEPRCGWTVGGYTCSPRVTMRRSHYLQSKY